MSFKALLVHDGRESDGVFRAALAEAGCDELFLAETCADAIRALVRGDLAPELVILDLAIDPRTTTSFLQLVRRLREASLIVVADDVALDPADERIADFVTRPIRPADLAARIRSVLRLRIERARRTVRERALTEKIKRLERDNHQLERLVCVDSLTGVANRRHVISLLHGEWKRAVRDHTPLSLVILDLDFFHAFNETYGHPGGDSCLRRVAEAITNCLRRPSDFLGRYGGEEFLAVLANTDAAGACIVAERLRATVEALGIPHTASPIGVATISAGFATFHPGSELSAEALVAAADDALRQAKSRGRNRAIGEAPDETAAIPTSDPWWTHFPTVVVDPWFADRVPRYLAETRDEARMIAAARGRACTFDRIRVMARRLKGSARDFGFDQIHQFAAVIERAARLGDRDTLRTAARDLEQYAVRVQVVYRRTSDSQLEPVRSHGA